MDSVTFEITIDDQINAVRLIAAANTKDLLLLASVAQDISKGGTPFMVLIALAERANTFAEALDGERTAEALAAAITRLTAARDADEQG